jgi:hypothetical protein
MDKIRKKKVSNFKNRRKGAIVIAQLVTVILLVLGFTILIIFFYSVDWTGRVDREVCHESVIFRATLPSVVKDFIPLKCKTGKICVTDKLLGKGDCKDEYGDIKGVQTVRVRGSNVDKIKKVEKLYAQEILDCWTMMGEGKVSLFHQGAQIHGFGSVYPSCVICSRIAFDKDLSKNILEEVDVSDYMRRNIIPGEEKTYTAFILGDSGSVKIGDLPMSLNIKAVGDDKEKNEDGSDGRVINPGSGEDQGLVLEEVSKNSEYDTESAIMFMQITAPEGGKVIKNTLEGVGIAWGFSALTSPKLAFASVTKAINPWTIGLAVVALGVQQGSVVYNRAVTANYCGDVSISQGENRGGCSVVRSVDYDVDDISRYCVNIESIP